MLDLDQPHQIGGGIGQGAETVDHFSRHRLYLGLVLRIVETAVERHTNSKIGHVILRDHNRRIDCDLRRDRIAFSRKPRFASFRGKDRILQHGLVKLEADLADMARLLIAQQIARSANIKIMAGELEACAKCIEIAQDLQAFLGDFAQLRVFRMGEVSIGPQF